MFLDDRFSNDRTLRFDFPRRTKFDGQSARHGGTLARVYGTDARVGVQVGRASAEMAERAFGGKPSGATRARTVVRVFSNASHGQLATLVCASVTFALSSVRSDRAMLLEELTGLDTGGRRVYRAVNFS